MSRQGTHGRRLRRASIITAAVVLTGGVVAGSVFAAEGWLNSGTNDWPYAQTAKAPILATVGDISCQPGTAPETEKTSDLCTNTRNQAQAATANQIEAMRPDLVAVLGDLQYQVGRYEDFTGSYDKTYGAFKFLQRPSPGNHEFYDRGTPGAGAAGETGVTGYGYFDYFNGFQLNPDGTPVTHTFTQKFAPGTFTQPQPRDQGQAGDFGTTGDGWYSYNLGHWHLISLNVECAVEPGGCDPNGAWFASETKWLAQDLAANHAACTLAYWHQPTFSSTASPFTSDSAEGQAADTWWKLLYAHGADVVLNGHDHVYSRFASMDPSGNADPRNGIREFIVGTGGESLDTVLPSTPNLQAYDDQHYGVMKLRLGRGGYTWDFESALRSPTAPAGTPAAYSDTGSGQCHGGNEQDKQRHHA
jgi:hypothetical protein